jgi:hypothetical protein
VAWVRCCIWSVTSADTGRSHALRPTAEPPRDPSRASNCGQSRARLREGWSSSQPFSQVAQSLQVLAVGVVHVLRRTRQVGLEAEVVTAAPGVEHLPQLDVDGVAHAIEDHADDVRRPSGKSPVLRGIVADRLALVPGPQGNDQDLRLGMAVVRLHPGAERRVVSVHATIDERISLAIGGLSTVWWEEGRCGGGAASHLPSFEVVRCGCRLCPRLPAAEEERAPQLDRIGRYQHVRARVLQAHAREVGLQHVIHSILRGLGPFRFPRAPTMWKKLRLKMCCPWAGYSDMRLRSDLENSERVRDFVLSCLPEGR